MTILLHGFWGQPGDWNLLLQKLPLGSSVYAPDLYAPGPLGPLHALPQWTGHFWRWVDQEFGEAPIRLVGYSMGARLAVNAAVARPERVERALFLSGNPLPPQGEREKWERDWSSFFLQKDWSELESAWQDQSVFANTPALPRRKTPEMREALGLSLSAWSPRLHPFAEAEIGALPDCMDWAFGALDQNYVAVAKTLQELPVQGQINIIPQAGHRLITEAADFIRAWLE